MKKFFLGIISHKGSTKREGQRNSLLLQNHPGFIWYHFIGDPGQAEEFIVNEDERIVYLKVPDNYESLPLKTMMIVKFANLNLSKTGVDYYISRGAKETQDLIAISNFLIGCVLNLGISTGSVKPM